MESVDGLIDQDMSEDFVELEVIPGMDSTRETQRQLFTMMIAAFPDFLATVDELLQDGDKVVAHRGVMDMAGAMAQMGRRTGSPGLSDSRWSRDSEECGRRAASPEW